MRLLWRHFSSSAGASVLVAVIVAAVTLLVALLPRGLAVMTTAELRDQVNGLSVDQRDPVAETVGSIPVIVSDTDPYQAMDAALSDIRDEAPPRLEAILGEPAYYSRTSAIPVPPDVPDRDAPLMSTRVAFDPRIESRVRMIDGQFPAAWRDDFGEAFPLTLSRESAELMRWQVGEERTMTGGIPVVLSGIFEAVDPDSSYWQHAPGVLAADYFDDGNSTPQVTSVAYANPLSHGLFGGNSSRTTVWYPIDIDGLDFADAAALAPELRSFTTAAYPLPQGDATSPQSLRFDSRAAPLIDGVLARAATTASVLAMVASGPLGVVLAVFALGARSVVERRRQTLSLASARGASGIQLRAAMALEGAVLGLIPAALAIVVAQALPARVGLDAYLAPALLGLAPAVLFAVSASPSGLRGTRADLGSAGAGRVRWILEVLVVGLAVTALVLLIRRGLASSSASVGVDPLLAATPLLLCLAVCIVVLRLYPLPLLWLAGRLRRRRGLSGFLGATRAVRDRSLALAAVLALVVGVSVSVFSSVLLTTLDRGVSESAAERVGADLRVEGPVFDTRAVVAASEIPGVAAVAGIDTTPAALRIDNVLTTLTLFVADTEQLGELRDLPAALTRPDGDAVPILISSDVADGLDPSAELVLEGHPVVIAGVADRTAGLGETSTWAIIDTAFAEQITGLGFLPRLVLVDLEPDADAPAVASALGELAGQLAAVTSRTDAEDAARGAPTTAGLRAALIIAIVAIAVLAALAIIMSSVIGADTRNRIIALLRTLGAGRRESAALVAWELTPLAIVAVVAGTGLGLALPWTVLAGVDLRPFTGGDDQPSPAVDAPLVLAVLGSVLVVIVVASVAAVLVGRRADPATSLRMGAE